LVYEWKKKFEIFLAKQIGTASFPAISVDYVLHSVKNTTYSFYFEPGEVRQTLQKYAQKFILSKR
jgi:hypothetical protein